MHRNLMKMILTTILGKTKNIVNYIWENDIEIILADESKLAATSEQAPIVFKNKQAAINFIKLIHDHYGIVGRARFGKREARDSKALAMIDEDYFDSGESGAISNYDDEFEWDVQMHRKKSIRFAKDILIIIDIIFLIIDFLARE